MKHVWLRHGSGPLAIGLLLLLLLKDIKLQAFDVLHHLFLVHVLLARLVLLNTLV